MKYCWYQIFDPNNRVKILHVDENEVRTYKDIITNPNIPPRTNLIYLNSRWDYEILKKQIPLIEEIQMKYGDDKINFIYTAQGIESLSDKIKWFNNMKDLNLNGFHINLSRKFTDYHDLWKEKNTNHGNVRGFPIFLLMDKSAIKIDTMFRWDANNPREKEELLRKLDQAIHGIENKLK